MYTSDNRELPATVGERFWWYAEETIGGKQLLKEDGIDDFGGGGIGMAAPCQAIKGGANLDATGAGVKTEKLVAELASSGFHRKLQKQDKVHRAKSLTFFWPAGRVAVQDLSPLPRKVQRCFCPFPFC